MTAAAQPTTDPRLQLLEDLLEFDRWKFVSFARRFVDSVDDAEDAVQNASLLAFTHLHQYSGDSVIGTWFCSIVRRSCAMLRRSRLSRPDSTVDMDSAALFLRSGSDTFAQVAYDEQHRLAYGVAVKIDGGHGRAVCRILETGELPEHQSGTHKSQKARGITLVSKRLLEGKRAR